MGLMCRLFVRVLIVVFLACSACNCADSRWVLITLLHTNDMHGSVLPRHAPGGLAKAATLVGQIREQMPNVVLLDGGDIIHGTPEDYLTGHVATISAMNTIGYDVATAGNHEHDFGLPTFENVIQLARFPFVTSNVRAASGGDWNGLRRYIVLDVDGVRVGIVGFTTLDTISLQWPDSISDIRIEDPIETARTIIPEVAEKSDVVVALSHLGAVQDRVLAAAVAGIDFIIGGHSHTAITGWEWSGDTLIAQAGAYARALGRIDFIARKTDSGAEIWSVNGRPRSWNNLPRRPLGQTYPDAPLVEVTDDVPEDSAVRASYTAYRNYADAQLMEVLADCPTGVAGRVEQADEFASANLLSDAVRSAAGSDVAVIDAGALGSRGIAPGAVTVGAAFELIGGYTRQRIVVGRMSAGSLLAGLSAGFERRSAMNAAISGASVECRLADGVPQAMALIIDSATVAPEKQLTVAAQAYVMMDIMAAVPGEVDIVAQSADTTREALVRYLRDCRTVVPPDLGRIKRTE